MPRIVNHSLATVMALSLAACGVEGEETLIDSPVAADPAFETALRTPYQLDSLFAQAAQEFNVPAELLKAIAYTETRWEMVKGEEELEGMPAAFGVMALRGEALTHGAELAGVSEEAARTDALPNIRAAAALLSKHADELGLDRTNLGAWAPAVARLSIVTDEEALSHYIHDEVYGILRQGAVAHTPEGEVAVTLLPLKVEADFPQAVRAKASGPNYANSIWRPSPNFNSRPTGSAGDPAMVIIHTCEGSYTSCWSWLVNTASGVSAHYVVKEDGSEISQLVNEANRAWHVGASYNCSLNGNVACERNGQSVNNFSVGIEHGGFASQASFPVNQIEASARLVCDITRDQAIPRDSFHIVAHGRLQPQTRTDPGPNWPWTDYLNRINSNCNSGSLIIDSNNNNNDTTKGYVSTSANWTSSANVAGYYGTGYYVASTQAISDAAEFYFYLPAAATKTIDAWWTSASDRSASTPFVVFNSQGTNLGSVSKNQQAGGGQWNTLGTWNFTAGWNKVVVSRWTTAGFYVIADAIRVR